MQENQMGGNPPKVKTDLDSQILFVEYMLENYAEPTGRSMLQAIRESLEKFREIETGM